MANAVTIYGKNVAGGLTGNARDSALRLAFGATLFNYYKVAITHAYDRATSPLFINSIAPSDNETKFVLDYFGDALVAGGKSYLNPFPLGAGKYSGGGYDDTTFPYMSRYRPSPVSKGPISTALRWYCLSDVPNVGDGKLSKEFEALRYALIANDWDTVYAFYVWRFNNSEFNLTAKEQALNTIDLAAYKWTMINGKRVYFPFSCRDIQHFIDRIFGTFTLVQIPGGKFAMGADAFYQTDLIKNVLSDGLKWRFANKYTPQRINGTGNPYLYLYKNEVTADGKIISGMVQANYSGNGPGDLRYQGYPAKWYYYNRATRAKIYDWRHAVGQQSAPLRLGTAPGMKGMTTWEKVFITTAFALTTAGVASGIGAAVGSSVGGTAGSVAGSAGGSAAGATTGAAVGSGAGVTAGSVAGAGLEEVIISSTVGSSIGAGSVAAGLAAGTIAGTAIAPAISAPTQPPPAQTTPAKPVNSTPAQTTPTQSAPLEEVVVTSVPPAPVIAPVAVGSAIAVGTVAATTVPPAPLEEVVVNAPAQHLNQSITPEGLVSAIVTTPIVATRPDVTYQTDDSLTGKVKDWIAKNGLKYVEKNLPSLLSKDKGRAPTQSELDNANNIVKQQADYSLLIFAGVLLGGIVLATKKKD